MLKKLKIVIFEHKVTHKKIQAVIGVKAGIIETRLSQIIHGKKQPTAQERRDLAQVLETDESLLFSE